MLNISCNHTKYPSERKTCNIEQALEKQYQSRSTSIIIKTLYVNKAKSDKQISHAFENGIPMILWIGENELKNR
jgi:histidyl-tRNA synthetase